MTKQRGGLSKGQQSRQRIVRKAAVLFNQKGYAGCSMQDVVDAVGLEKGTIYSHFGSKESLAEEAFDYAWHDASSKRASNLGEVDNIIDKLKLHVRNCVHLPPFPGGCPLLNTAIDADNGNPALKRKGLKALHGWRDFLANMIQAGQSVGEIVPEAVPQKVAIIIISAIEGATAMEGLDKQSGALVQVEEHLNAYFEHSLRLRA